MMNEPTNIEMGPRIFVYESSNPSLKGFFKVGFTNGDVKSRIAQQTVPGSAGEVKLILTKSAVDNRGRIFTDIEVHNYLLKQGAERIDNEWFKCSFDEIIEVINHLKRGGSDEQ
ncbi:MAG: GIY-YIG nuclease family protein [Candidatus Methanomethylophilaceae archaeon]|nr:GIY-YIG nuclease family protein [Candidatus Methanomethylophilaceae archaeon]